MIDNEPPDSTDEASSGHQAWIATARQQFEDLGAGHNSDPLPHDGPSTLANTSLTIPGYRLHNILHRGGQGTVYRATQESTGRVVAIKVMHAETNISSRNRSRFEQEIQILAQLAHPNVVTIHDSGVEEATIYIVMDYVGGESLDEWIRRNALVVDLKESLQLFAEICDAVNAAHLRGVIHRDMKPRNVIVDQEGHARVLDFGLAKLTEDSGLAITSLITTKEGQFVGTLLWASPEQVQGQSHQIDLRTDVYSLGVVFYQMLTGKFPYDIDGGMTEIARRISDDLPERPSLLRPQINDEVETIVLKCLAKEPQRRYQTAGEVARDIRHYLAGEPIEAKRASTWYVLRTQMRRHRLAFIVSVLVLALLVQSVVALSIMNRRESRLRREAEIARDEATRQARIADAVNTFLNQDVLAAIAPENQGLDTSMRDVLDAASSRIGAEFEDESLVAAAIHLTIGNTYLSLSEFDASQPHLQAAFDLRSSTLGFEHQQTLEASNQMAILLVTRGRYDQAEQWLQKTLDGRRKILGEDHKETIAALANLAMNYLKGGQHKKAEPLMIESVERFRKLLGEDHEQTQNALHNLGLLYNQQSKYVKATEILEQTLEASKRKVGEDHPDTLLSVSVLASVYTNQGRYDKAEQMYRVLIEKRSRILGEAHLSTLYSMNGLAVMYSKMEHHEEALELFSQVFNRTTDTMSPEDQNYLSFASNLATCYDTLGRFIDARPLHAEAVERGRTSLPADSWYLGLYLSRYGYCLHKLGELQEAKTILLESVTALTKIRGEDDLRTKKAVRYLIDVYDSLGDRDGAAHWRSKLTDNS